jgi:hypothetical protein
MTGNPQQVPPSSGYTTSRSSPATSRPPDLPSVACLWSSTTLYSVVLYRLFQALDASSLRLQQKAVHGNECIAALFSKISTRQCLQWKKRGAWQLFLAAGVPETGCQPSATAEALRLRSLQLHTGRLARPPSAVNELAEGMGIPRSHAHAAPWPPPPHAAGARSRLRRTARHRTTIPTGFRPVGLGHGRMARLPP